MAARGRRRVLVTGSSGTVGRVVLRDLRGDHDVRGFDRRPPLPEEEHRITSGSLEDRAALGAAMAGCDAVIHLAADPDPDAAWTSLLPTNVVGTYNVFEAAVAAGVRRVVFASSGHVSWMDTLAGVRAEASRPPNPGTLYGVTKAFGETLGRYFSQRFELSVICLRIGWIQERDHPDAAPANVEGVIHNAWVSHRDLAQIVRRALAVDLDFGIFYAMSGAAESMWDLADARERLGYEPQD